MPLTPVACCCLRLKNCVLSDTKKEVKNNYNNEPANSYKRLLGDFAGVKTESEMEITEKEYQEAIKIIDAYNKQEAIKKENKIKNCKHLNTKSEVSEWHQNGQPDRWRVYCIDCEFVISS